MVYFYYGTSERWFSVWVGTAGVYGANLGLIVDLQPRFTRRLILPNGQSTYSTVPPLAIQHEAETCLSTELNFGLVISLQLHLLYWLLLSSLVCRRHLVSLLQVQEHIEQRCSFATG